MTLKEFYKECAKNGIVCMSIDYYNTLKAEADELFKFHTLPEQTHRNLNIIQELKYALGSNHKCIILEQKPNDTYYLEITDIYGNSELRLSISTRLYLELKDFLKEK